MILARKQDWPSRLARYVEAHSETPFEWGNWDCVLAAAGAIEAMTGVDPAAPWRGQYSTQERAEEILGEIAPGGLTPAIAHLAATLGLEELAVPYAQRGDLVIGASPATCGFVGLSGQMVCFPSIAGGIIHWPLERCARAWRVPCLL